MDCIKYRIYNLEWSDDDKSRDPDLPDELIAYIGVHSAAGDELNDFFLGECLAIPVDCDIEILTYLYDYYPDI